MGTSLFPPSLEIFHQVIANLPSGIDYATSLLQTSLIICYQCLHMKWQNSFDLGQTGMDGKPFFSPHVLPTQGSTREETSTSLSTIY